MSQIQSIFSPRITERPSQQRIAFWMITTLCGVTFVVDAIYFYLAFHLQQPQTFGLAWITLVFGIVTGISALLTRAGWLSWAAWLIVGSMAVIWPLVTGLFVSDIGLTLSLSPALVTLVLAQILPKRQIPWAVAVGVISSIVTIMLDIFGQTGRLFVSEIQVFVSITVVLIVIAYGYFFAQGFAGYSLRVKLVLAFLVVTIAVVGVVDAMTDLMIRNILNEDTTENLQTLANAQARLIGDLLANEVETLRVLSQNNTLHEALSQASSLAHETGGPVITTEYLNDMDKLWQQVDDHHPLIQSRLDNAAAGELSDFRNSSPNNAEVFITDKSGALAAATGRTSDFNQADEQWWQAAYNNGQGSVYIGRPEFDESSQTLGVNIALPIYTEDDPTEVDGVLKTSYSFAGLMDLLLSIEEEQAGKMTARFDTDLLIGNQLWNMDEDEVKTIEPETMVSILASEPQGFGEFEVEGVMSFVGQSLIANEFNKLQPTNLDWRVLTYVERETALGPIREQRQTILLVSLGVLIATTIIAVGVTRLLVDPIVRLTSVAKQVAAGNLKAQAQIESSDEIGTLTAAFNSMTAQLRENIDKLEDRVVERTQQLETVVEVSQRLSRILELNELMRQVVTLIKETFNYYHVHIYLLAEDGNTLLMAEGYGSVGAEMKRQAHHISINAPKSLVARAARERQLITVENVRQDPSWLPNPLLPETRSEMAIPVHYGSDVVGVLDVQSDKTGGLSPEDESLLQALANQIANAVRNARQFAETQDALHQAQRLQAIYTGQVWQQLGGTRETEFEHLRSTLLAPLKEVPTPEALAALQEKHTVEIGLPVNTSQGNGAGNIESPNSALATPLKLRGQIIGVLGIQNDDPSRRWTADEIALVEAVSEQMSLALENARLFEETQRSAWRDRLISESTAKVWSAAEIEEVMRTAVAELGEKLGASEVVLRLGTDGEA